MAGRKCALNNFIVGNIEVVHSVHYHSFIGFAPWQQFGCHVKSLSLSVVGDIHLPFVNKLQFFRYRRIFRVNIEFISR